MRDYVLGLDIGGTKIAVGILDGNDKLIGRTQFSAKAGESPEMVFTLLMSSIDELLKRYDLAKDDISSIGVGVPGIISSDARSVLFAPNISILNSFDIYGSLKAEFPDAFIVIENDANCACYAEQKIDKPICYVCLLNFDSALRVFFRGEVARLIPAGRPSRRWKREIINGFFVVNEADWKRNSILSSLGTCVHV